MAIAKIEPGKTKIGWIGTGVMGTSMVGHLMNAGFSATVYNRSRGKAEALLAKGAKWGATPRAVAEASDVVFSIVGFPNDVREVMLGQDGALAGSKPGNILVDMTTSDPSLAAEIYEKANAQGVHSVDAPVSGGDVGAKNAALSIMVGGDKEVVDALAPCFNAMGKTIVHQGGAGAGQHTKMVNQILIASGMIGVCEALLYGYKAGLDLPTVMQSVGSGAAGSWSLSNLGPRIMKITISIRGSSSSISSKTWGSPWRKRNEWGWRCRAWHWPTSCTWRCRRRGWGETARTLCNWRWRSCRTWIGRTGSANDQVGRNGEASIFKQSAGVVSHGTQGKPHTDARRA
jgi:3-hydroxyisobutyrate dehydrogenase